MTNFHFGKSVPLLELLFFHSYFLLCVFGLYDPCTIISALLCIFEVFHMARLESWLRYLRLTLYY